MMIAQRPPWTNLTRHTAGALALTIALAWSGAAAGRDMTGKGGIGVLQPIGDGTQNTPTLLAFRYWRTQFAFELLAGFDTSPGAICTDAEANSNAGEAAPGSPTNCGARQSSVRGGATVLFRLLDSPQFSAGLGGRVWFILDHLRAGDSQLGTVIELPFQVEYFLNDNASVQAGVGPVLLMLGSFDEGGIGTTLLGNARNGVQVRVGGRYSGGAGFTYYF